MATNETATLDGVTHLNSLEVLNDVLVDGNLTVIGTISGETELTQKQVVTTITTVGNGTLTAAGLVGGFINRTGPTAAYTDTTATAAQIIALLPGAVTGSTIVAVVKNATAFMQTIAAGTGVTLPATVLIPAFSETSYLITVTSATTVSFAHIATGLITSGANQNPYSTTISTVGAGTLTAAAFVGSVIARSGSQSGTPFADTTDTAANIIAATPNLVNKIGTSMLIEYANNTNAVATVGGGTGVTVSGIAVVPANTVVQYLLTYTAAATLTMVGVAMTQTVNNALTLAGATSGQTILKSTDAAGSGTLTLPTTTDTLAGIASTQTLTGKTITDFIDTSTKVCTAPISFVTSTTLQNITGLSVAVTASGTYAYDVYLTGTSTTNGGLKLAMANSGSTTSSAYTGKQYNGATLNANTTTTTMGNAVAAATTVFTDATLKGVVIVNAGGNLTVQAAQNASHADTTTINIGSYMTVRRIA